MFSQSPHPQQKQTHQKKKKDDRAQAEQAETHTPETDNTEGHVRLQQQLTHLSKSRLQ